VGQSQAVGPLDLDDDAVLDDDGYLPMLQPEQGFLNAIERVGSAPSLGAGQAGKSSNRVFRHHSDL
jgi:hypothetical protein